MISPNLVLGLRQVKSDEVIQLALTCRDVTENANARPKHGKMEMEMRDIWIDGVD